MRRLIKVEEAKFNRVSTHAWIDVDNITGIRTDEYNYPKSEWQVKLKVKERVVRSGGAFCSDTVSEEEVEKTMKQGFKSEAEAMEYAERFFDILEGRYGA